MPSVVTMPASVIAPSRFGLIDGLGEGDRTKGNFAGHAVANTEQSARTGLKINDAACADAYFFLVRCVDTLTRRRNAFSGGSWGSGDHISICCMDLQA